MLSLGRRMMMMMMMWSDEEYDDAIDERQVLSPLTPRRAAASRPMKTTSGDELAGRGPVCSRQVTNRDKFELRNQMLNVARRKSVAAMSNWVMSGR